MLADWPTLKAFLLALGLPQVTLALRWGQEALKAHGKMWCHRAFYEDATVFKASHPEREMLMDADPQTYFLHPHHAPHDLVLVRAGRIDPGWARARLMRQWRDAAPKRWLKVWDAAQT